MNINEAYPSKFLKASDLKGAKVKVTIDHVSMEPMDADGKQVKPVIYFKGKDKGLACNKTNAMIIAAALGPETADWEGCEIYVYPGKTQFNGQMVDCLKVEPVLREAGDDDAPF